MAVNYKKGLRTYENEKFERKVTAVGDEDDDQPDYEEIAEYVNNPSEEKKNQNKYTGWNERGKSQSRNSHKKKFGNNRNENTKDIDLQLPTKQLVDLKVVSRKWRTTCVVSAFVCVGLMSALLWLMLSTKASPCEYVQCLHNGNCSVSGDKAICNCHGGFYGLKCEGTPCVNYICDNSGTCFLDEFQPKCACKNGFTGNNCTITPCSRLPCEHGGNCLVNGSIFSCTCLNGFTGLQCEIYVADFEDNMDSMFIQDLNSDHNWTIHSNSTISIDTGPSSAYKGDYYLYFETSSPVKTGSVARLFSRDFIFESTGCLKFHYHMYGYGMGTLYVYQGSRRIWMKSGNQGNQWQLAELHLRSNSFNSSKVSFEAVHGTNFTSDIAIDDIQVLLSSC